MLTIKLLIIVLLIGANAFFVASEFSLVRVRTSRIDQLIAEGNKKAASAKKSNLQPGQLSVDNTAGHHRDFSCSWVAGRADIKGDF